ncbi:MAG TPA: RNA polymerase factor sigma-54 [Candidatus Binatia bacterium]|jgi:RNA polymerase sigma-54 factor|nr:RNA polymerase factor sigma-54 [Candidatus Binatia bacterium]
MALEAKLTQRQVQRLGLVITPQLRQAIKILQLPRDELDALLHEEIDQNPLLAVDAEEAPAVTPEEAPPVSEEPTVPAPAEEIDWRAYLENYHEDMPALPATGTDEDDDERLNLVENQPNRTESLSDHLAEQLRFNNLTAEEEQIASLIIGNLNSDGYLQDSIEDIAASAGVPLELATRVLEIIQACDPPGVAARDVRECLLLQLRIQGLDDLATEDPALALAGTIVQDHLSALEGRRFERLAKDLGVTVEEVTQAVKIITSLDPKPGRNFDEGEIHYVEPDVYVHKLGDEYVVTLNEDGLPRLKISASYRRLLAEEGAAKDYVQEKLRAATWLIKSIHQRQRTLLLVAQSIVKFQREFLTHGVLQMRPLVLRDVAEDVGLHESTVSRAIANKYVATPRGIYSLKKFFTTGLKGPQGQDVAAESVKERIRELINNEDPARPLSDEEIAQMLSSDNVTIARRTVAKYRESMNILPSAKRKHSH